MPEEKKSVLITGTSTGLGNLAALTLARHGHRVYATMRDTEGKNRAAREGLQAIARDENLPLTVLELDVTAPDCTERMEQILDTISPLDVLVNNAGFMSIGIAEAYTEDQVRQQMELNFFAPVRLTRTVLPQMRQRKSGLIVHVSSIVGRVLFPACAFYCASKFALEAYAEVLHYELTPFGIDSVIVQPGPFPTVLLGNSPGPADTERASAYGQLADIRDVFMDSFRQYFASDEAPDPQLVADAILRLTEEQPGRRPLRTVCGPDYGAITINQQTAPIQAEVLRALGMGDLAARAETPGE